LVGFIGYLSTYLCAHSYKFVSAEIISPFGLSGVLFGFLIDLFIYKVEFGFYSYLGSIIVVCTIFLIMKEK